MGIKYTVDKRPKVLFAFYTALKFDKTKYWTLYFTFKKVPLFLAANFISGCHTAFFYLKLESFTKILFVNLIKLTDYFYNCFMCNESQK